MTGLREAERQRDRDRDRNIEGTESAREIGRQRDKGTNIHTHTHSQKIQKVVERQRDTQRQIGLSEETHNIYLRGPIIIIIPN